MLKTVGNLKDSVAGLLQGTNLNNVTNLYGALERAARTLVQQADVPEASGNETITLYDGVEYYLAPTTIFGGALNLIRRQGDASSQYDYNYKVNVDAFTRGKHKLPNGYMVTFEYDEGTALIGISSPNPSPKAILDTMTATTGWTAAGGASGLTLDETVYYQYPGSLRFNLASTTLGTLTKTITSQNLAKYEDVGVAFLAIATPSATNLTSLTLRIGSSASAYDEVTATAGFLGAWKTDKWTLVAFDMSTAVSTGTPNWSAITYLQVRATHGAAITNMRVGGLFISLPSPHEILYQSAALFMASGANPTQTITDDNDTIILSDPAYTLFEFESAIAISEQASKGKGTPISEGYRRKLYGAGPQDPAGLYNLYRADNPSQELRTVGNWYND